MQTLPIHSYLQYVNMTSNTTNETSSMFLGPSTPTLRPPVLPLDDLHHHLDIKYMPTTTDTATYA